MRPTLSKIRSRPTLRSIALTLILALVTFIYIEWNFQSSISANFQRQDAVIQDWYSTDRFLNEKHVELVAMKRYLLTYLYTGDYGGLQRFVEVVDLLKGQRKYAPTMSSNAWGSVDPSQNAHEVVTVPGASIGLQSGVARILDKDRINQLKPALDRFDRVILNGELYSAAKVALASKRDPAQRRELRRTAMDSGFLIEANNTLDALDNIADLNRYEFNKNQSKFRQKIKSTVNERSFYSILYSLYLILFIGWINLRVFTGIKRLVGTCHVILSNKRLLEPLSANQRLYTQEMQALNEAIYEIGRVKQEATLQAEKCRALAVQASEATAEKIRALEASEFKSDFLANMSHEIRTPMNAVLGIAEIMQEIATTSEQKRHAATLLSVGSNLLSLINNILDLSKIESKRIVLENTEFNFESTLKKVFNATADMKKTSGNRVYYSISGANTFADIQRLVGDELRVTQILTNIISNAMKFTDKGKIHVSVSTKRVDPQSVQLHLSIQDTGIGMSPESVESIFEKFVQAETGTTRKFGGSGLGLSISKELITLMGGEIQVSSSQGVGTTFSFYVILGCTTPAGYKPSTLFPGPLEKVKAWTVFTEDQDLLCSIRSVVEGQLDIPVCKGSLDEVGGAKSSGHRLLVDASVFGTQVEFDRWLENLPSLKVESLCIVANSQVKISAPRTRANPSVHILTTPILGRTLFLLSYRKGAGPQNQTFDDLDPELALTESDGAKLSFSKLEKTLNVLFVEDNEINTDVALFFLKSSRLNLHLATNGIQALKMIREGSVQFDLVITDIEMPEMDGYALLSWLKDSPQYSAIPKIALTAHAVSSTIERCYKAGATLVVTKPTPRRALIRAIESVLGKSLTTGMEESLDDGYIESDALKRCAVRTSARSKLPAGNFLSPMGMPESLLSSCASRLQAYYENYAETIDSLKSDANAMGLKKYVHTLIGSLGMLLRPTALEYLRGLEGNPLLVQFDPEILFELKLTMKKITDELDTLTIKERY